MIDSIVERKGVAAGPGDIERKDDAVDAELEARPGGAILDVADQVVWSDLMIEHGLAAGR